MTEKEEKIKDLEDEKKSYAIFEAVANSEGGQKITKTLKVDILSVLNEITFKYKELTHIQFIALSAKLSEKLTMLRVFARASKNKKVIIEELEAILKEDL